MGTIFDEDEVVLAYHLHDGIHVGNVPSHVGHQQNLRTRSSSFPVEVFGVHAPLSIALNENRNGSGVFNHAWDGMEGEGVGQNLVTWLNISDVQSDEHG